MKFMTVDLIASSVLVSLIVSSLGLFYYDINKKVDAEGLKKVGTITLKQSVAQRKYGNQVVWEEVEINTPVYNNDSIRTAEISTASITLNDGKTTIILEPNSLIKLVFTRDEFDIEFQKGSVSAKRDASGSDKKLNIRSKDTVISISNAELSLSQDKDRGLNVQVNKGVASINKGDEKKELKENQKAVLKKDKFDVYKVNLKLINPEPNKYTLSSKKINRVNFSWVKLKKGFNIYLEVSKERSFNRPLLSRIIREDINISSAELPWGNYYWRLRAIDRKTNKTSFSESRNFIIAREEPVILLSPRDNTAIPYKSEAPHINFKWTPNRLALSYRLIIAQDPGFNNILRSIDLKNTAILVKELQKGSYYWRVDAHAKLSGKDHTTSSSINTLKINQSKEVEPPALVYPADNQKLNQLVLKNKSIIFSWKNNPEIHNTKFFISRDKGFKSIVYTKEGNLNYSKYRKELPVGVYFWRVAGYLKGSSNPVFSSPRRFSITKTEEIKLARPADNTIFVKNETGKSPDVIFSWNRSGLNGKYRLIISNDRNFKSIYRQVELNGVFHREKDLDAGEYFWRVEFYDRENVQLMKSPASGLVMLGNFSIPRAVNPGEGASIDMTNLDNLTLKWRGIRGADEFRIGLFRVEKSGTKPLLQTRTKSTKLVFKDLQKLNAGRFLWTIQAIDYNPDLKRNPNRILRRSPVARTYFDINLGRAKEDVKKIKLPRVLILK